MNAKEYKSYTEHTDRYIRELAGKTVVRVRHASRQEALEMGWYTRLESSFDVNSTVIEFTDDTYAVVLSDNDGRGSGHLEVWNY